VQLFRDEVDTFLGRVALITDANDSLYAMNFTDCTALPRALKRLGVAAPCSRGRASEHERRLRAYMEGDVAAFDDALLRLVGTPFQTAAWNALRRIPHGQTATYGEIAAAVGRPRAARAVGAANHSNPIAIAVPCHRVVGSDGALTGYAGGLGRKQALLEHERKWCRLC
jgi:methylated-DNA-[protein]-cysteine S-methyltransferase